MKNRPESFEDVLNIEYAGTLVRKITWHTGSAVYDEDLIQEVLLRGVIAWRRRKDIQYPRAFFGKIARDTISDHW
jgi:DNA-directed RNA polymerase specialized sigma24 family protein